MRSLSFWKTFKVGLTTSIEKFASWLRTFCLRRNFGDLQHVDWAAGAHN
jgi:hypothetical protein